MKGTSSTKALRQEQAWYIQGEKKMSYDNHSKR